MCKEKEAVAAAAAYNIYVVDIYVDSCQPTYLPAQEPRLTSMDVTIYDRLCGRRSNNTALAAAETAWIEEQE